MNRTLWYTKPAGQWEEALPLGNGRMGAMISGEVRNEKIQLNEESMWYGGYVDRQNPDAHRFLPEIRELLSTGQIQKAQQLMGLTLTGCPNSMHPYQTLGDIYLYMDGPETPKDYKRALDLNRALATVEYTGDGTVYHREMFISHPADCMIIKLEARGRKKINFTARLDRQKQFDGVGKVGKDCIQLWGNLGRGGGEFSMLLAAKTEGGRVRTLGESLIVENADIAYLYFRGDTTYQYSSEEKAEYVAYITERPMEPLPELWNEWNYYEQQEYRYQQALRMFLLNKQLEYVRKAMQTGYEQLKQEHMADYGSLFDRMELRLEAEDRNALPTDLRLEQVAEKEDLQLVNLLFDYGRYLLIACSRKEGLPATLQGLWNKDFQPPWDSKYTININTEMNYWPAEPCNLSECHMPLFGLLKKVQKRGRKTAREMYGCRGFVAHHNTDMHGDTVPQDLWIPATYWPMGGAWLSTHIWTHYQYTRDKRFLAEYFSVLAEAALFFVDYLVEKEGYLVTNPSVSPENSYRLPDGETGACCVGATMDYQILRDLFSFCIEAWKELEEAIDPDHKELKGVLWQGLHQVPDMPAPGELVTQLRKMLDMLPPTRIDSTGRIMEWMEEYEEPEPGHRHISHLYGLYPSDQITVDGTPQLAQAAARTLEERLAHGGGHTGWSRAWIINHYAKLWQGDAAYENICRMLEQSTYPNLFDKHPPFQIDGNFGVCSSIAQMLVQSTQERVVLLPALPEAWSSGSVRGLRVVGGAALDMEWKNGELVSFSMTALGARDYLVKYREQDISLHLEAEEKFCFSNE